MSEQNISYHAQDDHDLLVMLLTQVRAVHDGIRDLRGVLSDTQKELVALRLVSDRHDHSISQLERDGIERQHQTEVLTKHIKQLEQDFFGRIERLERESIDPLNKRIDRMEAKLAGAILVLATLWVFLSPIWSRLVNLWLQS